MFLFYFILILLFLITCINIIILAQNLNIFNIIQIFRPKLCTCRSKQMLFHTLVMFHETLLKYVGTVQRVKMSQHRVYMGHSPKDIKAELYSRFLYTYTQEK